MLELTGGQLPTDLLYRRLIVLLEQLFPVNWFQQAQPKDQQHPAYIQWALCHRLLTTDRDEVSSEEIAKLMLNMLPFVILSKGDPQQLQLGLLSSIGNEIVQRKITSRVCNPAAYSHILVELYVAAWHKLHHHHVILYEKDGWPDLAVFLSEPINVPVFVECKHLHTEAEHRIRKDIQVAGSQIKRAKTELQSSYMGVMVLDVSALIPPLWKGTNIPDKVLAIATLVQRALSGAKNRSVHLAIIVWDTYSNEDRTFRIARRCLHVRHNGEVEHVFPGKFPRGFEAFIKTYVEERDLLQDYVYYMRTL